MPAHDAKGPCLFRNSIFLDELLGELGTPVVDELAAAGERLIFQSGTNVFARGETPHSIFIHRGGVACLNLAQAPSGTDLTCPVVPRCIYGLVEILADSNFEAGLMAETTSEFDVIDRDKFLSHIRRSPGICFGLAKILSRRYREAVETIKGQ